MKTLHFHYKVQLDFTSPVSDHYFVLRFAPKDQDVQTIVQEEVKLSPRCRPAEQKDGFGNQLHVGNIREQHSFFYYEVSGVAQVDQSRKKPQKLHPLFRYESPLTKAEDCIKEFYEKIRPSETDSFSRAVSMMHSLYGNFRYVPGTTGVRTSAAQALRSGSGVCQDYAHILVSLCRLDGIPSRYVAGLMVGEGASHAWMEIYAGGMWIPLDPTNDRCVDDGYIKISHGRDYGDCAVERGTFRGNALQRQNVYVKVEELW